MHSKFYKILDEVFETLAVNNKLVIKDKELLSFSNNSILTPIGDVSSLLFQHKSPLKDQIVDIDLIRKFIVKLTEDQAIVRLNHIGFCYKVSSQATEKERLLQLIRNSKYHLYQEASIDEGAWLFVGNTENWEDPLLELVPVEESSGEWVDYWLPHIQVDIDTTLTESEINSCIRSIFGESTYPFSIAIDKVVYIVRNHLGTIDGVNLKLDLATSSRDVQYHRENLLKRIDK